MIGRLTRWWSAPGDRHAIVLILLGLAIAERVAWAWVRPDNGAAGGEAFMVARALAEGRGFADAYQLGQGPTAHLLPLGPAFAGLVYRLFGVGLGADGILTLWAVGCSVGSYYLFFEAFGALGLPLGRRVAALAFLALAPVYITYEAVDFRAWEGGLTVLAGAAFLHQLAIRRAAPLRWGGALMLAALAALTFFINPVFGIGVYAAGALFVAARWPLLRAIGLGAAALAMLAALVVPWTLRNARVLGAPVLLRSNAGLELALANRPDAVDGRDAAARYYAQLNRIHPHSSVVAYRTMQRAGGEVAYARALGQRTWHWLAGHPAAAARLFARHVVQFFLPPDWAFSQLDGGWFGRIKAALAGAIALLGLAGLVRRLWQDGYRWLYPAAMILVPAVLVAPFQPIARYCYMIYALSAFLAVDVIAGLLGVRGARAGNPPPSRRA